MVAQSCIETNEAEVPPGRERRGGGLITLTLHCKVESHELAHRPQSAECCTNSNTSKASLQSPHLNRYALTELTSEHQTHNSAPAPTFGRSLIPVAQTKPDVSLSSIAVALHGVLRSFANACCPGQAYRFRSMLEGQRCVLH
jgi:hypothetical protein